jgi:hypothetical protein
MFGIDIAVYISMKTKTTKIKVECNNLNCKHHWNLEIDPDRIVGNRIIGLPVCPKCNRMDSPYIIKENTK